MAGKVVVIGGGATAVSFTHHILDEAIRAGTADTLEIWVIEKSGTVGPGLAYTDDVDSNLLNTRAGGISAVHGDPGHFVRWLETYPEKWTYRYPGLSVPPESFPPRGLFGLYLQDTFQDICRRARAHGTTMIVLADTVTDVVPGNTGVAVELRGAGWQKFDHAVLAIGSFLSRTYAAFADCPGFHRTPYPIHTLALNIPKDATVGIIGSRLSAIDTALGLKHQGHTGRIHMVSRGGRLPGLRGTQWASHLKYLNRAAVIETFKTRRTPFTLDELMAILYKELRLKRFKSVTVEEVFQSDLGPAEWLDHELEQSLVDRHWQSILYGTNPAVDLIWHYLAKDDRNFLNKRVRSQYIAYRASIPRENGARLRQMLATGQLHVRGGFRDIAERPQGGFAIAVNPHRDDPGGSIPVDTIVDATGAPTDLHQIEHPLVERLLSTGVIRGHLDGGIDVSFFTGAVVGQDGTVQDNLVAIGPATTGAYFFTTALETLITHASDRAKTAIDRLLSRQEAMPAMTDRATALRLVAGE